jgi:outer membrane immunogenic protein
MVRTGKNTLAAVVLAISTTATMAGDKGDFWREAPGLNWAGLYAGATIGYSWGESTQKYDRAGDHGTASLEPDGAAGSALLGYNWMVSDQFMLGLEGDVGVLGVSQGATTVFDGHVWSSEFGPFLSTLRGRAGYAFGNALVYATGGLALATITDTSLGNTPGETAKEDGLRAGWVIGGGVDYALYEGWTMRGEFLHMDFGRENGRSDNNEIYYFENSLNLFRIGATHKF